MKDIYFFISANIELKLAYISLSWTINRQMDKRQKSQTN